MRRKIEAGADVLMTQQVYSAEILAQLPRAPRADRHPGARRHHAAAEPPAHGVHPQRAAPASSCRRTCASGCAQAGENGVAEGIAQARELLEECRPFVQGTYLVPSFGRYEVVGELVTLAKRER